MSDIVVYSREITDGLGEAVRTNNSIAYLAELRPVVTIDEAIERMAKASGPSMCLDGLFCYDSIFVSTGWNLNDDVFSKEEIWAARNTPVNKPVNMEHVSSDIVGHIVESRPVDDEGNAIAIDTPFDLLPNDMNLLATSVIYRHWDESTKEAAIATLIDEMIRGEWAVSMEAHFRGFDYGLRSPQGNKIVARNENTSFLTKHLRRYGGSGVYEQYTIGRLLKNVTFSGKGIVRKPANPKSQIVGYQRSAARTYSFPQLEIEANIVEESNGMAEVSNDTLKQELDQVKAALKAEQDAKASLETKIREQNAKAHEDEVNKLKASITEKETALTTAKAELTETKAKLSETEAQLAEAAKKSKDAEDEMNKMKKDGQTKCRVDLLVKSGKTEDEAKTLAEQFSNLNDEQFNAFAEVVKAAKKEDPKGKPACDEDETDTEAAAANLLNGANGDEDVNLSTGTETTSAGTAETRQKLGKVFNNILNRTRASVIEDKE